jgi:hypothetical protein
MQGQQVSVRHLGTWLPAVVIWEYVDTGRPRALVRFETEAGLVLRQLRWVDELRPGGPVIELPLLALAEQQDDEGDGTQAADEHSGRDHPADRSTMMLG